MWVRIPLSVHINLKIMVIEAVYCKDKKEFEYLEEIRETNLKDLDTSKKTGLKKE